MAAPVERCLLFSLPGPDLPAETARWLERGLAGVVLFARNIASMEGVSGLCRAIRQVKPDALIALDEEGGEVTRLEAAAGSSWPGARALGVVDDIGLTTEVAGAIAARVAGVGANVNLAPVADVQTCVANPVINNRAFGTRADLVGRHAAAFVRGTQSAGVAACAKHFPGHGATAVDSHLDLPVVDLGRDRLLAEHVAAFAPAVEAGVAMLMTAHVLYPGIDDRPATLSSVVLGELARDWLGFQGTLVTDALGMGAIAGPTGVVPGAVAALGAGADLLCVDGDLSRQAEVIAGLQRAWRDGEVASDRLEQAAGRAALLAAAYAPGPGAPAAPVAPGGGEAGPGGAGDLGLVVARRALRTGPLPVPPAGPFYIVELSTLSTGAGEVRTKLTDALRRYQPASVGVGAASDAVPTLAEVLGAAGDRPVVIVSRDAHRHPAQAELIRSVLDARPGTVVVGTGSDADAALAPGRFIPARGAAPPNLEAVAEVLLGLYPTGPTPRRGEPSPSRPTGD